jgi:cysteine-rich repeat protein
MKKNWLFSGILFIAAPTFIGCPGALCGDGVEDLGENCDDTNNADGDGCSAVCDFEAAKTDYRINELVLIDDKNDNRFSNSNLLINQAIGNSDLTKALTVLAQFDSTVDGAANIVFGPGVLNADGNTFDFLADLGGTPLDLTPIPTTITGGVASFTLDPGKDFILPIETELGSGIFVALPVKNVTVKAILEKKQKGEGGLFFDVLGEDSTLNAQLRVGDLCGINIVLIAGNPPVNLLDAFDDGSPTLQPGQESSITPPVGVIPDDTNCIPCAGPGAGVNCVLPETGDEVIRSIEDLYDISATFEAENEHPQNDNTSLIINPIP